MPRLNKKSPPRVKRSEEELETQNKPKNRKHRDRVKEIAAYAEERQLDYKIGQESLVQQSYEVKEDTFSGNGENSSEEIDNYR